MNRGITRLCVWALFLFCSSPLFAGTLATDGSVFFGDDPIDPPHNPIFWSGSTSYIGTVPPANLFGEVEWAVYAPGTFPAAFTGYSPNPTHFVYAYQVFETGPAPVSLFSVAVFLSPAFDIGTFTGGGVSGDATTTEQLILDDSATWEFAGIGGGGTSVGLAFSSPFFPTMGFGVVLDDGEVGPVIPLPTPVFVFEPATRTLAVLGLFGFAIAAVCRRATKRNM